MSQLTDTEIRESIMRVAGEQRPRRSTDAALTQTSVLDAVVRRLNIHAGWDESLDQVILTQWQDLFRTGLFAWGKNLNNPDAPFFHFTDRGQRLLDRMSRDPANPAGYMRHLAAVASLNPIAQSYLAEGLACFVGGFHKAAAVMIGAAAESLILELRDIAQAKLATPHPKGLSDWRVKTVLDALHHLLEGRKGSFPKDLREEFEAYWLAFAQQIRATRNDAGHPSSVEPVSEEGVHASYLIFPDLARLSGRLADWMAANPG